MVDQRTNDDMKPEVQSCYDAYKGKSRPELLAIQRRWTEAAPDHKACSALLDEMDQADSERQELRHQEIRDRLAAIEKTHWTVTPVFWLTVAGVVAASLAAWFAWLAIPQSGDQVGGSNTSSLQMPPPTAEPSPPSK